MTKKDIQIQFGKKVRTLRKAQGFTQESFALHCNIDRSYMGCIERGEQNISLVQIQKIAKGLKTTPSKLLEGI